MVAGLKARHHVGNLRGLRCRPLRRTRGFRWQRSAGERPHARDFI